MKPVVKAALDNYRLIYKATCGTICTLTDDQLLVTILSVPLTRPVPELDQCVMTAIAGAQSVLSMVDIVS